VVSWPAWPSARHSVQRRTRLPKRGQVCQRPGLSVANTAIAPITFKPESPIWPFVRAYGLDSTAEGAEAGLIYVNMLGQRFFQEDTRSYDFLAAAMGERDTGCRYTRCQASRRADLGHLRLPTRWSAWDGMLRDLPMSTLKTASSSPGTHWRTGG